MLVNYLPKVGSAMGPLIRIQEVGVDTNKNSGESSLVVEKKTKWRNGRERPNVLQNSTLAHKMPETDDLTCTNHNKNFMSASSLYDQQKSEAVVVSSGIVKPIKEEKNNAVIYRNPLNLYDARNSKAVVISSRVVKPIMEEDTSAGISHTSLEYKAETKICGRAVFKRPSYLDFLKFCFERFEVGVWSSRSKKVMTRVIDYLMGDMKHKLLFCWDLSHCTPTGFKTLENRYKTLVFKDLSRLWEKEDPSLPWEKGEYNESNTLLLDDSPYKALLNPAYTAVFPNPYKFQDKSDNSLGPGGDVRAYLEELSVADDIQKFVEQHPFGQKPINETNECWGFYLKVLSSVCSFPTTT